MFRVLLLVIACVLGGFAHAVNPPPLCTGSCITDMQSSASRGAGYQGPASTSDMQNNAQQTLGNMGIQVPVDMTGQTPATGDLSTPSTLTLTQTRTFTTTLSTVLTPASGDGWELYATSLNPLTVRLCDATAAGDLCSLTDTTQWSAPTVLSAVPTAITGAPLNESWQLSGSCAGTCSIALIETYTQGGTPNAPLSPSSPNTVGLARMQASPLGQMMTQTYQGTPSDPTMSYNALRGTIGPTPTTGTLQAKVDTSAGYSNQLATVGSVTVPCVTSTTGCNLTADTTGASYSQAPTQTPPTNNASNALGEVAAAANLTDQITRYGQVGGDGVIRVFTGQPATCKEVTNAFYTWALVTEYTIPLFGSMMDASKLNCCQSDPKNVDVGANMGFCTQEEVNLAASRLADRAVEVESGTPLDQSICLGVTPDPSGDGLAAPQVATNELAFVANPIQYYLQPGGAGLSNPKICGANDGGGGTEMKLLYAYSGAGAVPTPNSDPFWVTKSGNQLVRVATQQTWCVFPSLLAKIIQEQGRIQINAIASSSAAGASTQTVTFPFYASANGMTGAVPPSQYTPGTTPPTDGSQGNTEGTFTFPKNDFFAGGYVVLGPVTLPNGWQMIMSDRDGAWGWNEAHASIGLCAPGATCPMPHLNGGYPYPTSDGNGDLPGWQRPLGTGYNQGYIGDANTWKWPLTSLGNGISIQGYCDKGGNAENGGDCHFFVDAPASSVTGTPNPPTTSIPPGRTPTNAPNHWTPTYTINGNAIAFWQWDSGCLPTDNSVAAIQAAADFKGQSLSGSLLCPPDATTYVAVCPNMASCGSLPANPQAGNDTPWWVTPIDTSQSSLLTALDRYVTVQGGCDPNTHQCQYTVNALPVGVGGQLHVMMPLDWSLHSYGAPPGGGWDATTLTNHDQIWFEAYTWPADETAVSPRLQYCLGTAPQCPTTSSANWHEVPVANPLALPGTTIITSPQVVLQGGSCDPTGCHYQADISLSITAMPWLSQSDTSTGVNWNLYTSVLGDGYSNTINWDYQSHPNCDGFTLDQFMALDFSKIDLSEYTKTLTGKALTQFTNGWPNQ